MRILSVICISGWGVVASRAHGPQAEVHTSAPPYSTCAPRFLAIRIKIRLTDRCAMFVPSGDVQ
eukprot:1329543-Amorphochlora_amoeboformis.AAC.1